MEKKYSPGSSPPVQSLKLDKPGLSNFRYEKAFFPPASDMFSAGRCVASLAMRLAAFELARVFVAIGIVIDPLPFHRVFDELTDIFVAG